jgi:hypothetical protein
MKLTFIKLRRGILEAKHVQKLGIRFPLYIYLLDRANWETGKVLFYRDQDVADQFEMPIRTIREWRRRLWDDGYISCLQKHDHQEIEIKKWSNPRDKHEENPIVSDEEGSKNMELKGSKNTPPLKEGYIEGYIEGSRKHVTPTLYSENRNHTKNINLQNKEKNLKLAAFFSSVATDCFNDWQLTKIKNAQILDDDGRILICVDNQNDKKELNGRLDLFRKIIMPTIPEKSLYFRDVIAVTEQEA